jgi:hypothetical protein
VLQRFAVPFAAQGASGKDELTGNNSRLLRVEPLDHLRKIERVPEDELAVGGIAPVSVHQREALGKQHRGQMQVPSVQK